MNYMELLDQLRAEYDAVVNENKSFRAARDEFQRKVEQQVAELTSMEQALLELERKHQLCKEQYDAEISRRKAANNTPSNAPATSSSPSVPLNPHLPPVPSADRQQQQQQQPSQQQTHPQTTQQQPSQQPPNSQAQSQNQQSQPQQTPQQQSQSQSQPQPQSQPQSQSQPQPQPQPQSQPQPQPQPQSQPQPQQQQQQQHSSDQAQHTTSQPPSTLPAQTQSQSHSQTHPAPSAQNRSLNHSTPTIGSLSMPNQVDQRQSQNQQPHSGQPQQPQSQIRSSQALHLQKPLPSSQTSQLQHLGHSKLIDRPNNQKVHPGVSQRPHVPGESIGTYNPSLPPPHSSSRPLDRTSAAQRPTQANYSSSQSRLPLQDGALVQPQHGLGHQSHHLPDQRSQMKFPRLQPPDSHNPMQSSAPLPSPSILAAPGNLSQMMPNGMSGASHSGFEQGSKLHGLSGSHGQDSLIHHKGPPFKKEPVGPNIRPVHNSMNPSFPGQAYRMGPNDGQSGGPAPHMIQQQPHGGQNTTEDDWGVTNVRTPNVKVMLQKTLAHDSVVCCVRYSWDGQFLATGSNKLAQIFDASTGQSVARFSKDNANDRDDAMNTDSYVRAVCFSPDGNWLITGAEDHVVKVWDVRTRTVKHRLTGHDTDIYSVDASQNSRFIISGSGDKKAKLWNLETGELLSTLGGDYGPTDGITSVSVSPTNRHVAAGSLDKIVRVWDVETASLVRQFEGHKDSVYSVVFSPDGGLLLSGSLDKTVKLWDLVTSQPPSQCRMSLTGHKDFVLSVAFSPDNRWLISGSKDRTVQFWDARSPSSTYVTLQGHKNSVISIAHNPMLGNNCLATGSGDCRARTWSYH